MAMFYDFDEDEGSLPPLGDGEYDFVPFPLEDEEEEAANAFVALTWDE